MKLNDAYMILKWKLTSTVWDATDQIMWYRSRVLLLIKRSMHSLQWRHNGCDGVSNHWRLDCLLNRLSRHTSKKTLKLRVTGLCERNSPVTGEFLSQRSSNACGICFYLMTSSSFTLHWHTFWQWTINLALMNTGSIAVTFCCNTASLRSPYNCQVSVPWANSMSTQLTKKRSSHLTQNSVAK